MSNTKKILDAIKAKDWHTASETFKEAMTAKVSARLHREREHLREAFGDNWGPSTNNAGKQVEVKCGCGHTYHITAIGLPNAKCPKCKKHNIKARRLVESEAPPLPTDWKKGFQYPWQIGGGGSETPYLKDNRWKLYVWNAKERKHYLYDFASDTFENE